MYVTTNSALVWKRMADENQQSARLLARISIGLFMLMIGLGAFAYSAHSRYNDLCGSIKTEARASESPYAKQLGEEITSVYCS
jgi:hypothetical protein